MGINALICAYCMSVLYLDGVKASEAQQTLQGILIVFLSLNIATAKPLDGLSKQRPLRNIFNLYTLLTVTCQFGIHLGEWLLLLWLSVHIYVLGSYSKK